MEFKDIVAFEELSSHIVKLIYVHGWPIVSGQIDQPFGCGKIDQYSKAVWTTDGKRIEVFLKDAFIITQSKEVDPLYQLRKQQLSEQIK